MKVKAPPVRPGLGPGGRKLKPGGLQEEEKYTDSGNYSEPVYETIPPYSIPANFPDVKVSVL